MFFIDIIVFVRHYIVSNFFAKRNKRFAKHLLVCKYKKHLYINFFMRLFLSSKHFRDCVNINNNVKFVIQIETYLVKINDKAKIDIIQKTILYCFIDQSIKISSILRDDNKDIQFDVTSYLAYLTLKYIFQMRYSNNIFIDFNAIDYCNSLIVNQNKRYNKKRITKHVDYIIILKTLNIV